MSGLTVSDIIADEKKVSSEEIGDFRVRSPIRPITLVPRVSVNRQFVRTSLIFTEARA